MLEPLYLILPGVFLDRLPSAIDPETFPKGCDVLVVDWCSGGDLQEQVASLHQIVEKNKNRDIHLVGYETGATIAWAYKTKYPQYVKQNIYINPLPPFEFARIRRKFLRWLAVSSRAGFLGLFLGQFTLLLYRIWNNLWMQPRKYPQYDQFCRFMTRTNWEYWNALSYHYEADSLLVWIPKKSVFPEYSYRRLAERFYGIHMITVTEHECTSLIHSALLSWKKPTRRAG